jgi:hypothetical protein
MAQTLSDKATKCRYANKIYSLGFLDTRCMIFLEKQNKIESILHLDNVFTDLIMFSYLMQTPVLSVSISRR